MFAKSPTKNKPKPAKPICPVGQNIWNMLQKKSYRVSIVGDCEFAESWYWIQFVPLFWIHLRRQWCRKLKKFGGRGAIVIGGDNLPSPVEIGLTDLPNIAGPVAPLAPPVPASLSPQGCVKHVRKWDSKTLEGLLSKWILLELWIITMLFVLKFDYICLA